MLINALLLAERAIRRNLMRSFLTVLGIVIGVAAVITMVTLGDGATRMVASQIASLGSNLLLLRPGQMLGPGGGGGAGVPRFRLSDADALQNQIASLRVVAPVVNSRATLVAGGQNWSSTINGSTNDYFSAGNWTLAEGRLFEPDEEMAGRSVCVIGHTIRQQLFANQQVLGAELRVKNIACEIIGVLASKGQGAMGQDQDDMVVMPIRTVQRRLTGNQDVGSLMLSVRDGIAAEPVMEQIKRLMRERRKLADGEEDNFSIMDTKQIAETLTGTIRTMTGLLGAVAAVSLLVGGIGIMNIMLVSVTERTREIGIRLAIGALEHEVLLQFLIESVVLSALGGLIGILLAFIACLGLSALMHLPFTYNPGINLLAFIFSGAIGIVFGYFPARRAARLDPIQALRYE
ncbi:multidrug ABC transporter substrate-binding protein [Sterolibacterium denitrificans]|uniref:Multidrug ABC transporter substrate-binding protein n=2 Tax=Sterolibacterium denitrificans TaxID=157592 RepID=A0A656ZD10_9PROT|nr:multidrug ABC transporter substrate-binding protein [Sterolibacterium denitrificans]